MARVLLLRHAQSVWNAERRWQGWADPPLSALGRRQAVTAAQWLRSTDVQRVVSSDLLRAQQTAEILASELGAAAVTTDAGLRERDLGEWTGCTTDEIVRRWPGQLEAWRDGGLTAPPGGENRESLESRVLRAVSRVHAVATGAVAGVVTHGGVIRMLERHLDVEPGPLANLAGRWFEIDEDGALTAGDVVVVPGIDGLFTTATL